MSVETETIPETAAAAAPARSRGWQIFTALLPYAALVVIFMIMGGLDVYRQFNDLRLVFYTGDNFRALMRECAPIIVAAVGMTPIIVSGGIDLSVGSTMGVAGAVAGAVTNATQNAVLGLCCGVLSGLVCGVV